MFTEVFGAAPRVRLLDFLADHIDFDYTISQMREFTGISRPALYDLVASLMSEAFLVQTRQVGASRFFRLNLEHPKVLWMLQTDFERINKDMAAVEARPLRVHAMKPSPATRSGRIAAFHR